MKLRLKTGLDHIERDQHDRRLYKQYLRRIDVQVVLNHYGARNQEEQGDEILHSCLLDTVDKHHSNGDENPSALANVEEKLYLCRTYSRWRGGDMIQFIMRMERKENFNDVVPIIAAMLDDEDLPEAEKTQRFKDELLEALHPTAKAEVPIPDYDYRVLRGWAQIHPYTLERGISHEAASRLQIGYDEKAVRITFPHWLPDGRLVGWQKRRLEDPRWPQTPPEPVKDEDGKIVKYIDPPPKYKNNKGLPKRTTLYNLQRVLERDKEHVIVVESPMSVAKAETLMTGPEDLLAGVVASFGAEMTDEQIDLLKQFRRVYVFMDNDGAGNGAAKLLTTELHRHVSVYVVPTEIGKDLGDYDSRDELIRLLDKSEPAFRAMARWNKKETKYAQRRRQRNTPRR